MQVFDIYWSPEGRCIATVLASDERTAKRKTPQPYKKYLGEVYVQHAMRCNKCHRAMKGTTAYDGACFCGGLIEATPDRDY